MEEDKTPNTPNTSRPIGIKPITIKPMQPLQKSPAANAAKPVGAPVADTPKPVGAPVADTPKTEQAPTPPDKPISLTPSAPVGKPISNTNAPTIRLKTIRKPPEEGDAKQPGSSPQALRRPQTIQPPSIKPTTQSSADSASKSKTSRISLDSAFGDTEEGPKIHIGPTPTAPVGKITSSFNADSLGAAKGQTAKVNLPLASTDGEVTRRRTLRVKAPSSSPSGKILSAEAEADAPTVRKKKALVLKKNVGAPSEQTSGEEEGEDAHVSAFSAFQSKPIEKTNPIFPVLAVAATIMIITLTVLYMSQACGPDRSLTAFSTFHSISAPDWPGQVNTR